MILYMYIAPGQGQTAPRGQNFDVNRNVLSPHSFAASFKQMSLKSDFIQFFSWFNTCIYRALGIQPPGDKVLMSTETSCHFDHLLLVSNHRRLVSEKSIVLPFFPYKSIRGQIWPCHKIGQGQPRVIIWTNLSTQCCIISFKVIGHLVPEKKIF